MGSKTAAAMACELERVFTPVAPAYLTQGGPRFGGRWFSNRAGVDAICHASNRRLTVSQRVDSAGRLSSLDTGAASPRSAQ